MGFGLRAKDRLGEPESSESKTGSKKELKEKMSDVFFAVFFK